MIWIATVVVGLGCCHSVVLGADVDEAIRKIRRGTLTIETAPGAEVRVEQQRHEFWFGAALASQMFGERANAETAAQYKKVFLENFNAAVTENALKWPSMERRQGQVDYSIVDAILQWTDEHEIPLRGHNIFWGIRSFIQPWVLALDDATLRETLKRRALDIGTRYKGRFAEYDLNNEMIHGNYYEERLGPEITRDMADWVRQGDSDAVLFVNDYDILTGRRLDDYVAHIRGLLDQGVPIGGIGVQGHLHGDSFDPAVLKASLATLAQFKLPIVITEFNFPGQRSKHYNKRDSTLTDEEEQAKAKAIVDYYRICFAEPAVKGILMWGFWEGANWIPQSSLYRRDWSPTPAAQAYRDLIYKQWWTRWQGKADAAGRCEVPVFYGRHKITANGNETFIDLKRAEGTKTVSLK
ncbi:MAG: endo-1,4-beta-xylanase [Phycisphaerae bacterium]|nr:endo-1,4-beta-xylanase [Phycisphaerae bacterium]